MSENQARLSTSHKRPNDDPSRSGTEPSVALSGQSMSDTNGPRPVSPADQLKQIKVEDPTVQIENKMPFVKKAKVDDHVQVSRSDTCQGSPTVRLSKSDNLLPDCTQASSSKLKDLSSNEDTEYKPKRIKLEHEDVACTSITTTTSATNCTNTLPQDSAMDYSTQSSVYIKPTAINISSACSNASSSSVSSAPPNSTFTGSSSSGYSLSASLSSSSNTTVTTTTTSTLSCSLGKLPKKNHARLQSASKTPNTHDSCLYYPGAYSSHGQLSSQLRRQMCCAQPCTQCCLMCPPYMQSRLAVLPGAHETSQVASNSSSARTESHHHPAPIYTYEPSGNSGGKVVSTVKPVPVWNAESLLEIASRLVAEHIPYEYIEQRYSCIPEPVQRRIIFWSFPRDESYIRLYSSISSIFKQDSPGSNYHHLGTLSVAAANALSTLPVSSSSSSTGAVASASSSSSSSSFASTDHGSQQVLDTSAASSLFNSGLLLMLSGAVHQVLQVGFNLSGVVTNASPFGSIPTGSGVSSQYYTSHSAASSSTAILEYTNLGQSTLTAPEYARYSVSTVPYLSGRESSLYSRSRTTSSYLVSITFDRCKITSVTCTCNSREYHLFWCEHVVALAVYRIRKPLAIELRVPISESLFEFDRYQLQKLLQYLIAEHHVQILPTVQRLVDELSSKNSPLQQFMGAPDPTAGACVNSRHDWYLNEEKISTQIRDLVKYVTVNEAKQIIQLFHKIVEMLKIKDSNGPRFLRIITEQFLYSYSHYAKPEDSSLSFDPYIFLWDHLTNLWIYIVIDSSMSPLKRVQWREMFRHWCRLANCPREDTYFCLEVDIAGIDQQYMEMSQSRDYLNLKFDEDSQSENYLSSNSIRRRLHHLTAPPGAAPPSGANRLRKRRILERAFDATFLTWDDVHLQTILRQDGPVDRSTHVHYAEYYDRDGFPIWSEHLPTAAIRIASLRANGHSQESLRLSMAVVRYLKNCQYQKQQQSQKHKAYCEFDYAPASESWIGNPIDPIGVIFDTLAEASLTPDSKSIDACYALVGYDKKFDNNNYYSTKHMLVEMFNNYNEINCWVPAATEQRQPQEEPIRPRFRHVTVAGALHRCDTYLAAAVTVALIGLAQHRRSPDLDSQRDKTFRQEVRLMRKLLDIKLDSTVLGVLQKQASLLVEIGLLSDMVANDYNTKHMVPFDIAQIPGLVRYLFGALFPNDPNLAFDIGLRSLRFFSFKEESRTRIDQERYQKFRTIMLYYLDLQLILAKTMLLAARNDENRLNLIFVTIKSYVNNASYLNRLAHEVYQFSLSGTRHEYLLSIAYAFGLHLMKLTLTDMSQHDQQQRKPMITWLVACASEISFDRILHLMHHWQDYFTPPEAVRQVAAAVLSPNFTVRTCNHIFRQDEIASTARQMVVESALKDPASCILNALSLCEKDQMAFDTLSKVVEKAGAMCHMNAHQLFTVARYMEHQGVLERACKIALLAANQVNISLSADTHHLIGDLQWAFSLTQSLGTAELTELINILVKNVRCAPVLADMIRRCTFPSPAMHPSKHLMLHSSIRHSTLHGIPDLATNPAYMEHLSVEERIRRRQAFKAYPLDRPPLSTLLNAAVRAYIETVMKRLEHISPRHYSDFIEFLSRAQDTIALAPDGQKEFANLLDKIKTLYKGKKKLMFLVKERFR